jgi:phospholipid transport system transporter-binding protein
VTSPAFRIGQGGTPDSLAASGALTFDTAAAALAEAHAALSHGPRQWLDLAGVETVDSAGLACVLAVVAEARRGGGTMRVVNAPAGLLTLAQVAGVEELLL